MTRTGRWRTAIALGLVLLLVVVGMAVQLFGVPPVEPLFHPSMELF